MTARVVGAVARHESEHKAERIRRKRLEEAREGRRNGGGKRIFGYKPGGLEVEPVEAEAIRAGADAIIGGASAYSVARSWNEAGLLGTRGKTWTTGKVVSLMRLPSLAGIRVYGRTGERFEGAWEPIISEDVHALLVQRLRPTGERQGARKGLLSGGILRCAECGLALTFSQDAPGRHRYKCDRSAQGGCGKASIAQGHAVEVAVVRLAARCVRLRHVTRAGSPSPEDFADRLELIYGDLDDDFEDDDVNGLALIGLGRVDDAFSTSARNADRDALLAKLRELDDRDAEHRDMFFKREIDRPTFNLWTRELDEERRALEEQRRASPGTSWLDLADHLELVERHRSGEDLPAEDRESLRSLIVAALPGGSVYVWPGQPRARVFDVSRLDIRRPDGIG
jgi:hypothetical protein